MPLFPYGPPVSEEIVGLSYYENSTAEADIPIPLESVSVNSVVVHSAAQVDIRQKYVYSRNESADCAYTFPLVPDLTVTRFRIEINDQIRRGVVKANEEAKKQYLKALEAHRMNLLREVKTDEEVFRIDIGSIEPKDEITVYLTYITELKNEIGTEAIKFLIPKTVFPNHINAGEKGTSSSRSRSKSSGHGYVAIRVTVALEGHLAKLESPSHNVSISKIEPIPEKISWTRAFVDVGAKIKDMNRDFVLLITPEDVDKPRVYTERIDENAIAVMAHLIPRIESDDQKVELIIAFDRSNFSNLEGNLLKFIETALLTFLHSIPVDSYFNIVGFGTMYEFLFHDSVQNSEDSLSKAVEHIKNVPAEVDNTHLYDLVQGVFSKNAIPGHLRQVFLLTGSQISNADKVLALINSYCHNTRFFALGIGECVSQSLVNNIAKVGNGSAQFVKENEQIDHKLLDQLKIALQPSLTDIHVKWNGLEKPLGNENHQSPDKIPPIRNGLPLIIYGIFSEGIPTGISITANSPDGNRSVKVPIDDERDTGDLLLISKMAAIKVIRELEKHIDIVTDISTCYGKGNAPSTKITLYQQRIKDEIIYLGCGNGIVSKYTTYVMIDDSIKTAENFHGTIQQRNIPLQPRSSCKKSYCCIDAQYTCLECLGVDRPNNDGLPGPSRSCTRELPANPQNSLGETDLRSLLNDNKVLLRSSKSLCAKKSENIEKYINVDSFRQELDIDGFRDDLSTMRSASQFNIFDFDSDDDEYAEESLANNPLFAIANLQAYSGYFLLTNELCVAMSISELYFLELEAQNHNWDLTAWATVLAILYMSTKLLHLKRSWELMVIKAEKWLNTNHSDSWHPMIPAARTLFR